MSNGTVNNTEQIAELFKKYGDEVFRTCLLFLKNRESAEDAVMEAYLRAIPAYSRFKRVSSEKTWLIRIAVNICKDMLKSPAYKRNVGSDPLLELAGGDELSDIEQKNEVSSAIASLPRTYREAAVLHLYNGFSIKECAKIVGVPQTTMAYRVRKAKEMLRDRLSEWYFS